MAEVLIHAQGLQVNRGKFHLQIDDWVVEAGQVVGVVGANGAGKTTLLRLLPGLARPDSGTLRVCGLDPYQDPVRVRHRIGMMWDDMPIFQMRIDRLLRQVSGYYPGWDADLAAQLIERFELDLAKHSAMLSRGEGTRLRLVLAMAFRPQLLVLDEPATGLDLTGRRRLLETVLEVVRDPARSVIISSHQLSDVERIADRMLVLHRGQVARQGQTSDLLDPTGSLEEALVAWGLSA
jgi:ABC-2 type transport system ATP-binding protein